MPGWLCGHAGFTTKPGVGCHVHGWLATGGLTAVSMALRFRSFGTTESAIVVIAGLIAGFVAGGILFCAVKREVEEVRVALVRENPQSGRYAALN